jgi:hypothetical protein
MPVEIESYIAPMPAPQLTQLLKLFRGVPMKVFVDGFIKRFQKENDYPPLYGMTKELYSGRSAWPDHEPDLAIFAEGIANLDYPFEGVTEEEFNRGEYHDEDRDKFLALTIQYLDKLTDPGLKELFRLFARYLYRNNNFQAPVTSDLSLATEYATGRPYFDDVITLN